jgi:hypothetical protein
VVQFDDFGGLEEPGSLLRKMHGQHRADGEVRRDEHRDIRLGGQPRLDLAHPFVGESGGADDRVDSVVDEEFQIVHHNVGMGEVDDDLGAGINQLAQRIAGVDADGEGHVVGGLDGLDHRRADLAFGSQDSDSHGPTLMAHLRRYSASNRTEPPTTVQ